MKIFEYIICIILCLSTFQSTFSQAIIHDDEVVVNVRNYSGTPTLFVNNEPNAGMAYMTYRPYEKYYRDFGNVGVDFASVFINANGQIRLPNPVSKAPDSYDFSDMDKNLNLIFKANPQCLIFPRVYLFAPQWWMDENPEELMVYHDGTTLKEIRGGRSTTLPSWASEKWREYTAQCLKAMITHIKQQPYGKNVVGYHLASGGTDEWYYYPNYKWFFNERMENFLDYSRPQTNAFCRWLKQKYGTEEALQKAWHNNTVTFKNANIASKRDKTTPDNFVFFDPARSQHVIDAFDFEGDIVVETIEYFCKVVKDATDGKAFTGAFYGYVTGAVDKVYCSTYKLLQSPYIDFLCAPSAYSFREPGAGYSTYRTTDYSVRLHNKLWWDENDYYTYLTPNGTGVEGWTGPRDFQTTEMAQLRQLSNQIVHASAGWWFDMGGGWYNSSEAMNMIKKMNEIAENSINTNRESNSEIAIVVDEKSIHYLEMNGNLYRPLIMEQRMPVGKIGAPADWILMEDLDKAPDYKMYVFLNSFHVNDKQKSWINKLPSIGAKALVWVYAPGYIGDSLDVNGCFDITGIKLKVIQDKAPLEVVISNDGETILSGVNAGEKYGTENKIGPVIVGDDESADVIGRLYGFGEAGLITKKVDGVDTYFSAAPKLSASVLRAIAKKAGVHIYDNNEDVFYINKSFVGIHTPTSGKRKLIFPNPVNLYDVYNDSTVAIDSKDVLLDLPARKTVLFYIGTKKEWEELLIN